MNEFKKALVSLTAFILSACAPAADTPKEEPQTQSPETSLPAEEEKPAEPPPEEEKTPEPTPEKPKEKVVGSGKTPLIDKNENRITNLTLAIKAINGKAVNPDETFSFNDTVGVRSKEKGYKKATAFDADNNKVQEYGGGICQISTTLYLAALNSDFEIIERHKHSREVPYEKTGNDATVSFGSSDFKFKNNKGLSVRIVASMDKSAVYIKIIELTH